MMIENSKGYEIIKDIDLGNPMGVKVYVFYPPGGFKQECATFDLKSFYSCFVYDLLGKLASPIFVHIHGP